MSNEPGAIQRSTPFHQQQQAKTGAKTPAQGAKNTSPVEHKYSPHQCQEISSLGTKAKQGILRSRILAGVLDRLAAGQFIKNWRPSPDPMPWCRRKGVWASPSSR